METSGRFLLHVKTKFMYASGTVMTNYNPPKTSNKRNHNIKNGIFYPKRWLRRDVLTLDVNLHSKNIIKLIMLHMQFPLDLSLKLGAPTEERRLLAIEII
jgi:hypothetical protein